MAMSSALEARVISAILLQKNLKPAIKQGLSVDHFSDRELGRIYELIIKHYNSIDAPKTFPSTKTIKSRFPGFKLLKSNGDELAALVKELRYACLSSDLNSMAATITEIVAEEEPEVALEFLRDSLGTIKHKLSGNNGMRMSNMLSQIVSQYETAQQGGSYGLPWPFPCLTEDTLGKRPGDLIFIYGRPKSMKTWIAVKSAMYDYEKSKARVLFWSREMQEEQLALRFGSIIGRVDYQLLKRGKLPPAVWERARGKIVELQQVLRRDEKERKRRRDRDLNDFIIYAGRNAPRDFLELRTIIEEAEADIAYLDSFYHLQHPTKGGRSDVERLRNLIEEAKQLALDLGIPVVLIHQANREGENTHGDTMRDIARADAAAAECDLALRVLKKKVSSIWEEDYEGYFEKEGKEKSRKIFARGSKLNKKKKKPVEGTIKTTPYSRTKAELAIMLAGSRDGVKDGFIISANPGYEFEVINDDVNADDVKRWLKKEEELAEKADKREKQQKQEASSYKRNPEAAKQLMKSNVRLRR